MIYKDVVNILKDTLSRFKGVNLVKYQGDDLNNQQHNYKTIQCYIDDISHHQFNLTTNIVKAEYNIYILGFPEHDTPDDILDVQDNCYNVAINVLYYIDNLEAFKGIVRVYDYSIMSLSRFTGQANAGVRLSVVLEIPNGVDLCNYEDNFGEPYEPEKDHEITVDDKEIGALNVRPVKLPKSPDRC